MKDGAHDDQHIYRVLYLGLDIAEYYQVDLDILIASTLLHDIGRDEQFKNPKLNHALIGSEMAYYFIKTLGWTEESANHVRKCICTHRFRRNNEPESLEAKILFDADKLDVTGTIGIDRTLAYKGIVAEPLYSVGKDGKVLDGTQDEGPSFFQEYNFKLKKVYDGFYTERAKKIALMREKIAKTFYETILSEVNETYENGNVTLQKAINDK